MLPVLEANAVHIKSPQIISLLIKMREEGQIDLIGKGRGSKYILTAQSENGG